MTGFETDLSFVTDEDARKLIEDYYHQAVKAYGAGAYLGTLVACGGVLEGVLTWALLWRKEEAANSKGAQKGEKDQVLPIEQWGLSNLIKVASSLGLIGQTAKDAAWAVKEFRNFIHPYRLLRATEGDHPKSARPDEALALGALGGVKEICRSLRGRLEDPDLEERRRASAAPARSVVAGGGTLEQRAMNFAWLEEGALAGCRGPHSSSDLSTLRSFGIRALVRLADSDEADVTPQQVADVGLEDCHEPITDYEAPTQGQIDGVLAFIDRVSRQGKPVAISCGAGYGRTGTLLACYLVKRGASADDALETVRATAGRGPERDVQVAAIREYEARVKK